jgi:DNA-binding transcriptional MerR regulator
MRPIDLARAAGISVQSVRRYEKLGFIPVSARSTTDYRRYDQRHLHALLAARTMIRGYGWLRTMRIMSLVHRGEVDAALALVDARHADLSVGRVQTEDMLTTLRTVSASGELLRERLTGPLQIGEAARRVGVRVSTLRFWEQQGVLQPVRAQDNGYRLFDDKELIRLQVVALLRKASYGFPAIRSVLDELSVGHVEQAITAIEERKVRLADESRRCAAATAALWGYLEQHSRTNSRP